METWSREGVCKDRVRQNPIRSIWLACTEGWRRCELHQVLADHDAPAKPGACFLEHPINVRLRLQMSQHEALYVRLLGDAPRLPGGALVIGEQVMQGAPAILRQGERTIVEMSMLAPQARSTMLSQ